MPGQGLFRLHVKGMAGPTGNKAGLRVGSLSGESNLALHGTFLEWQRAGPCHVMQTVLVMEPAHPEQVRVCGLQGQPLLRAADKSVQVLEQEPQRRGATPFPRQK